jgi:hypothetical protein
MKSKYRTVRQLLLNVYIVTSNENTTNGSCANSKSQTDLAQIHVTRSVLLFKKKKKKKKKNNNNKIKIN